MPLDGAMLSQVKQEIETAVGARVDRIAQPGREELIVALRGRQGAYPAADLGERRQSPGAFYPGGGGEPQDPAHVLHAHAQAPGLSPAD